MIMKLIDVYSTINTDKNVFYSAYLKSKIQFNDVDPNKLCILDEDKKEVLDITGEECEKGLQYVNAPSVEEPI